MNNKRLETLGARINKAIYKVEELQAQLNQRLAELEKGETTMKLRLEAAQAEEVVQIDDCTHRDNTHCTLRNKQCYGVEHCSNYRPIILKGEACNLAPWEKAENYGIVKYTKEGLYDYGYNPSVDPEELPF